MLHMSEAKLAQKPREITHDINHPHPLIAPVLHRVLPPRAHGHSALTFARSGRAGRADRPVRAMQHRTLEALQPLNLGPLPPAQSTKTREQEVCRVFKLLELRWRVRPRSTKVDVPLSRGLVVLSFEHFVLEVDVRHELVLLDHRFDVREDFIARGVVRGPFCLLGEGVLVL